VSGWSASAVRETKKSRRLYFPGECRQYRLLSDSIAVSVELTERFAGLSVRSLGFSALRCPTPGHVSCMLGIPCSCPRGRRIGRAGPWRLGERGLLRRICKFNLRSAPFTDSICPRSGWKLCDATNGGPGGRLRAWSVDAVQPIDLVGRRRGQRRRFGSGGGARAPLSRWHDGLGPA